MRKRNISKTQEAISSTDENAKEIKSPETDCSSGEENAMEIESPETNPASAEEEKKLPIPDYVDLTQEISQNPNQIIKSDWQDELAKKMFFNLNREELKIVTIIGPEGSGKATLITYLAKKIVHAECPKKFEGTKIIEVFSTSFLECSSINEICTLLFVLLTVLKEAGEKKVILFFRDAQNFNRMLLQDANALIDALTIALDFELIRFVFTADEQKVLENQLERTDVFESSFCMRIFNPLDFNVTKAILTPRIEEISKKHGGIIFTPKFIDKILLMTYTESSEARINLDEMIHNFDYAASICELNDIKKFGQKEFEQLFSAAYKIMKEVPTKHRYQTAYHEAGHCLLSLVCIDGYFNVFGVTSIPNSKNNMIGATMYLLKSAKVQFTKKQLKQYAAIYLAGREAEQIKGFKKNLGAVSDLQKAKEWAYSYVYNSGMCKETGENCYYEDDDEHPEILSNSLKKVTEKEIRKFLKEARKYCRKKLKKHEKFLDILAKVIFEKEIINESEVKELWEKYLEEKKNK